MKFTYSWLKDFVEVKLPAEELADKLTMAGLEVTALEKHDGDYVFEIEITSNRPDWLSVVGIAREVAAITGKKLLPAKEYKLKNKIKNKEKFNITIKNKKDCPLYTAKIIRGVKVGPSPEWLRKRLEAIGCRSINNIVDITNYCLFTYGEPLHAFDLDKLVQGQIIVRRGKSNEKLVAIDGKTYSLDQEILVIADTDKAAAVAGVMGGKDTEVNSTTKNILLEAAVFDPVLIRQGRKKLGLSTDSSYRFERGLDIETAQNTARFAAGLIEQAASGQCVVEKNTGTTKAKQKSISLSLAFVDKILGARIPIIKIKNILGSLGFKIKLVGKNILKVEIPLRRRDVGVPEDLVEEIARVYGFDKIPASLPLVKPSANISTTRTLVSSLKDILVGLGLNEVITYSLMDQNILNSFGVTRDFQPIEVLNPLNQEQGVLRPTLIPGLAAVVARNINQRQDYVSIFEVASIFKTTKEELSLGVALSGVRPLLLAKGLVKEETSILHVKGLVEILFQRLGVHDYDFVHDPTGILVNIKQNNIGRIVRLENEALARLDIKDRDIFIAEINLHKLFAQVNLDKKYQALPKYPGINRDISFIVKESILVKDLLAAIKENGGILLRQAKVVDYYQGKQVPLGHKALTISCVYRSGERTLTEDEINPAHNQICSLLSEKFGVKIR